MAERGVRLNPSREKIHKGRAACAVPSLRKAFSHFTPTLPKTANDYRLPIPMQRSRKRPLVKGMGVEGLVEAPNQT